MSVATSVSCFKKEKWVSDTDSANLYLPPFKDQSWVSPSCPEPHTPVAVRPSTGPRDGRAPEVDTSTRGAL